MHNNKYILTFTVIMTVVVGFILAGMFYLTEPIAKKNEAVFNKRAILKAIEPKLDKPVDDFSDNEVQDLFNEKFNQLAVDAKGNTVDGILAENVDMAKEKKKPAEDRLFPVYIYEGQDKTKPVYVISVRGNGLWDEIWGNIALESDLNTIVGASFDHKGETPGLGAEIKDNPMFAAAFSGKHITNQQGEYTSVIVRKGGAKNDYDEVDAISGATVTCDGVTKMLQSGIAYYEPYFNKLGKK